jgi:gp178|nr:MAG TPA: Protein of unknown function (DUF1642) [Caudoviricetes sp.]
MKLSELIENYKRIAIFCDKTSTRSVILDLQGLEKSQKPFVPQFVADWYEKHKDDFEFEVWNYMYMFDEKCDSDFKKWVDYSPNKPLQTLVNMHQFGYTIEEKRYEVILCNGQSLKTVYRQGEDRLDFEKVYGDLERFTRKQLEEANFGWVFDCPGIEVREVE